MFRNIALLLFLTAGVAFSQAVGASGQIVTPSGGGGGSTTIAGTATKITVTGTCDGTTGTCTITIPDGVVLVTPNIGAATGTSLTVTGPVTSGNSSGVGGALDLKQGMLPDIVANTVSVVAPIAVTGYEVVMPGTAATGFTKYTNAANVVTQSQVTMGRTFGAGFTNNGSALVAGATTYMTVPYACTITAWNITISPADTATIDIWKIATGTAIPTVSNTITASAIPAISTGTAVHSTTLTGWSTGVNVSANDIIGINLKIVGGTATQAQMVVQCDQ
jgi:hypothetical protein